MKIPKIVERFLGRLKYIFIGIVVYFVVMASATALIDYNAAVNPNVITMNFISSGIVRPITPPSKHGI